MNHLEYLADQINRFPSKERLEAFEAFSKLGFPDKHDEAFKYTDLRKLRDTNYTLAKQTDQQCHIDLSQYSSQYACLINGSLFQNNANELIQSLTRVNAQNAAPALSQLNHAFWTAGFELKLPKKSEEPFVLWNLLQESRKEGVYTRNQIHAPKNSTACVIEISDSKNSESYQNHVTEIQLEENAHLTHIYIVHEQNNLSTSRIESNISANGSLTSIVLLMGSEVSRIDFEANLLGQNASCVSRTLCFPRAAHHTDFTSTIFHKSPHTNSDQIVKSVVSDSAKNVFSGTIVVEKNAQKIEAHQLNRNLLLNRNAKASSLPRLDIFADDVKCSHGSSTGQLDENEVFYLRSRGYTKQQAISALLEAFCSEILDIISIDKLRNQLKKNIEQRIHTL